MKRSIYDFMAYSNDKDQNYKVIKPENTSKVKFDDVISYIGCHSFDGDIDKIEILNHTTNEKEILSYSALSTQIIKL